MHVTDCVFLKKTETASSSFVYELWSKEFGKIRAFAKETGKARSPLGTGAVIQANVESKGNSNRVVSVKLKKNFNTDVLSYEETLKFLKIVSAISKSLPEGVPNSKLFEEYRSAISHLESKERSSVAYAAFLTKLCKTTGTYEIPNGSMENVRRFSSACEKYAIDEIVSIKGIEDSTLEDSVRICEKALFKYSA